MSKIQFEDQAGGLEEYFTNVEELRSTLEQMVSVQILTKRILAIYGIGGTGKSSLVKMFHLYCRRAGTPVALASGDEAKASVDILSNWSDDLKRSGVKLPNSNRTLAQYKSILNKINKRASEIKSSSNRVVDFISRAAGKTAEAAAGSIAGAAVGSILPGIGTATGTIIGSVAGGLGAEALIEWLGGFLSRSQVDLILDLTSRLTEDFLKDVGLIASHRRVVIILDTYDQITRLNDWVCELAQRIHPNALLIISGRSLPNWERQWPSWLAQTDIQELEPMQPDDMRELVTRYYATQRIGLPDPKQIDAIVSFARGLPIAVTLSVKLWVQYGVKDFQAVKPQVSADLVDRLLESVPQSLLSALEAAAVLRWFNRDLISALLNRKNIDEIYNELRQFPFVFPRLEGLALHQVVREIIDEYLQIHSPTRHRLLHERAAACFEIRASTAQEDIEKFYREWLYHRIRAEESSGIQAFQELAERYSRYRLVGLLRALMNDINTYPLNRPNSQLWREYYDARLLHLSGSLSEAEKAYVRVSESEFAEPKLRAYALCDLGQIWTRNYQLAQAGGLQKAFSVIEQSQQLAPELDPKLAFNFLNLRYAYMFEGNLHGAIEALGHLYDFYKQINDNIGLVQSLSMMKDLYGLLGDWQKAADAEMLGSQILASMPANSFLGARLSGHNIWHKIWSGRYTDAESGIIQAFALAEREKEQVESIPDLYRNLGLVLGLQKRWQQSQQCFMESVTRYKQFDHLSVGLGSALGFWGLILTQQKQFAEAEKLLSNSLSIKKELKDNNGIPEVYVWMGEMYETQAKYAKGRERSAYISQAEHRYYQCLDYRWTSRRYFECAALTGLARIKYAKNEFSDTVDLVTQSEEIAQQFRYYDLLASLYLYKGHIQWLDSVDGWPSGFKIATQSYQRALLYALSHNRFILDKVLWESGAATPMITIVSQCSSQSADGKKMLEFLIGWWETGLWEFASGELIEQGVLPETSEVSLAESEKLARNRELGDGAFQPSVVQILKHSLAE